MYCGSFGINGDKHGMNAGIYGMRGCQYVMYGDIHGMNCGNCGRFGGMCGGIEGCMVLVLVCVV